MGTYNISQTATVQDGATVGLGTYSGGPSIALASSGTCSKVYSASVTAAVAQTYDVNSGLTDAFGNALVYTTVKEVIIYNSHATNYVTIGGGTNPLFGSGESIVVKPGRLVTVGNVPVTVDGTHKVLTVTPSASCTYQIMILG